MLGSLLLTAVALFQTATVQTANDQPILYDYYVFGHANVSYPFQDNLNFSLQANITDNMALIYGDFYIGGYWVDSSMTLNYDSQTIPMIIEIPHNNDFNLTSVATTISYDWDTGPDYNNVLLSFTLEIILYDGSNVINITDFTSDFMLFERIGVYNMIVYDTTPGVPIILSAKTSYLTITSNESYQAGYQAGLETGYQAGYQAGYDAGYQAGYQSGYQAGYDAGFDDTQELWNDAYDAGYQLGYEQGHLAGYQAGLNDGSPVELNFNWITAIIRGAAEVLNIEIFPNIKIGLFLFIPLIFQLLWFILKWFK